MNNYGYVWIIRIIMDNSIIHGMKTGAILSIPSSIQSC